MSSTIFENPKSAILIYELCIKIFYGLISLWIILFAYIFLKALEISSKTKHASISDNFPFLFKIY